MSRIWLDLTQIPPFARRKCGDEAAVMCSRLSRGVKPHLCHICATTGPRNPPRGESVAPPVPGAGRPRV